MNARMTNSPEYLKEEFHSELACKSQVWTFLLVSLKISESGRRSVKY
jgi:hypothetical protein